MAFSRWQVAPVEKAVLANCSFLARSIAETDYQFKQVIPYVVVRHEDRCLLIWRTSKQTEARLHNLYSLGVGGHINDTDIPSAGSNIILTGMRREYNEEIAVEGEQSCELVGIINDDSDRRFHVSIWDSSSFCAPRRRNSGRSSSTSPLMVKDRMEIDSHVRQVVGYLEKQLLR